MGTSFGQAQVDAALDDLDAAGDHLDPATVMALRLVDLLTSEHPIVTAEMYADLRTHFTDEQVLELGSALAVASGWQRFIEAFGVRPDSWTRRPEK